ncbi:SpoIIE family protein phosphatase [Lachnoclostridium sp. Marseille-P6806]|uniref:SpoIIE family protein phosphatase n=1 Tax=Lachnoclostridium sp. Marseille-P6806 TaxID=2364793 RepID=UPI00103032DE|nr:SpoIIE family protein phosphatase [Lachnoclostridium sp. Marseille-P6806]
MNVTTEIAYKSLNHYGEILCGDTVEIVHREDSDIVILADGMGSGVRANMLSTLTSKIFGSMLESGAHLNDCVATVIDTLPEDAATGASYSTFTVLQIFHDGRATLIEYDNPEAVFLRGGRVMEIPRRERVELGKSLNDYRFTVQTGDTFLLMSDGTIHAGVGRRFSFGWPWEDIAEFARRQHERFQSPMREAIGICEACLDLYEGKPGDDTTVACIRVTGRQIVHLMTGPARNPEDDGRMVSAFMSGDASVKRIVSGGTSASILSRVLGRPLRVSLEYDPESTLPPMGEIEGIDLVTEGVLTLAEVIRIIHAYADIGTIGRRFFEKLERPNAADRIAKLLIEECTEVEMYVGTAINAAYQNPDLPLELGMRQNLTRQLAEALRGIGKPVTLHMF